MTEATGAECDFVDTQTEEKGDMRIRYNAMKCDKILKFSHKFKVWDTVRIYCDFR